MAAIIDYSLLVPQIVIRPWRSKFLKLIKTRIYSSKLIIYKRLHCYILLFLFLIECNYGFCQTSINCTGSTIQNNIISVEYSIGEIGITTLSGYQSYITLGVLQPLFKIKGCNLLKLIPNAFTPNKDNMNDCFGMKNWPATSSYELSVYNSWGQSVFKTTNILECWNGDFNGRPQPSGIYVYTIKANTSLCGQVANKGVLMLIR